MTPKESKIMAELKSLLVFKTHDEAVELSKELKRLSKTKRVKAKRVECDPCQNFTPATFKDEGNLLSDISTKAKCKLGKRVMFRNPDMGVGGYPFDTGGYFRYCNDFKQI